MEKINISIIVPVFNDENNLRNTIISILNQDYPRSGYEILVIDNNSTDQTSVVIEEFKDIIFLSEREIQSSYAARNKGVLNAKGDLFCFIDSDCIADKNWLKSIVKEFSEKKIDILSGDIIFKYKQEKPNIYEYIDSIRFLRQKDYIKEGFGVTANLAVRKEVFTKIGLFDSSLRSGGDYEFCVRAVKAGYKIAYCDAPVVYHVARSTFRELVSKTIRTSKGQKSIKKKGLLKKNCSFWQLIRPKYNLPHNKHWDEFGIFDKIKIVIIFNILHYLNIFIKGV